MPWTQEYLSHCGVGPTIVHVLNAHPTVASRRAPPLRARRCRQSRVEGGDRARLSEKKAQRSGGGGLAPGRAVTASAGSSAASATGGRHVPAVRGRPPTGLSTETPAGGRAEGTEVHLPPGAGESSQTTRSSGPALWGSLKWRHPCTGARERSLSWVWGGAFTLCVNTCHP